MDRRFFWALPVGILALFSKESSLLLLAVAAWQTRQGHGRERGRWLVLVLLSLAAGMALWALQADVRPMEGYELSLGAVPRNILILGFWLIAPPAWQTGTEWTQTWPLLAGAVCWGCWVALAMVRARQGDHLPGILLGLCLLALAPATLLSTHILPRYDYLPTAALAVALGSLLQGVARRLPGWSVVLISLVAGVSAHGLTSWRLEDTFAGGRPVHRLVVKEDLSRRICEGLPQLGLAHRDRLIFFTDKGSHPGEITALKESLGGTLGPRLVLGGEVEVRWTETLTPGDTGAFVVAVRGMDLEPMGRYRPRSR